MENQQHIWALYLNMARHNAYITLSYISELIGYKSVNEDQLNNAQAIKILNGNKEIQKSMLAVKLFDRHFPFLSFMLNSVEEEAPQKEDYYQILTHLFETLNTLRNEFTHYKEYPERVCSHNMTNWLESCFNLSREQVKDRFKLHNHDLKHLHSHHGTHPNKSFKYFITKGKNSKVFSDSGLAFFIALFLTKKQTMQLLDQLPNFKFTADMWRRSTRECYSISRMIMPKLRIESKKDAMALGMDMLNELKRCPKELFRQLNKADADCFRITPDTASEEDTDPMQILLLRHSNRFAYLTLLYFDLKQTFKSLRFHIDLGMYRHQFYRKKCVDSEEKERILQHRILGFGRLNEIEEQRRETFKELIPDKNNPIDDGSPYIVDTYAHYHRLNHKIGIYIGDVFPEKDKLLKNPMPQMWLSEHELPALAFYLFLKQDKNPIEGAIIRCEKNYRQFFSAIAQGEITPENNTLDDICSKYSLKPAWIPQELRDYFENSECGGADYFKSCAENKIKQMKKETDELIKMKSGEMADFLAADLLRFQPTADAIGADKLTSLDFQTLQASLAFYDSKQPDEMRRLFTNCKLIDSPIKHPFLDRINIGKCPKIGHFYNDYLRERNNYLDSCLKSKNYSSYHFLHPNRNKWKKRDKGFYIRLANEYLKHPVELPRGFFAESIKQELIALGNSELNNTINRLERVNTAYLIQLYFRFILGDDSQPFYNFKRSYHVFNPPKGRDAQSRNKPSTPEFYTVDELANKAKTLKKGDGEVQKLYHYYTANEKTIRAHKVQDMVLMIMAKELLINISKEKKKELEVEIENYKLLDISPDNQTDILSRAVPVRVSCYEKEIWQPDLKIKNYGDLLRLVRDHRIESLFKLSAPPSVMRAEVERELEKYDRCQREIFKEIHTWEKSIVRQYGITENKSFKTLLKKIDKMSEDDSSLLNEIRKAFSHNQYPSGIVMQHLPEGTDLPNIAHEVTQLFKKITSKYY